MESLLGVAIVAGCAVGMYLMMRMMMGGGQRQEPDAGTRTDDADEVTALREEVFRLRADGQEEHARGPRRTP